jgi:hypothetical protein
MAQNRELGELGQLIDANTSSNTLSVNGSITVGSVTINSSAVSVSGQTINGSFFSGTANNSSFLGGTAAASYQLNSTLNANIASYLPTYSGVANASTLQVGSSLVANSSRLLIGTGVGLSANGGIGSAGQVLHSNGTTVYWADDDQGVTSVSGTSGRITSSGGNTPAIDLATAGAGAASYSSGISALTVDAYGRVTSVTGSAGYVTSSGVTSVAAGTGLSGGTITSTGTISMPNVGPGAGSYSSGISAITLDAQGRVTAITGSASYATTSQLSSYLPLAGGTMTGRLIQSASGFGVAGRDDISTRVNSGFWETSSATTAEGWPENDSWYHLMTSTHSNDGNYFSMQFAGDFYNSNDVWYRATNNNGLTTWNRLWHSGNDGAGTGLDADTVDGLQASAFYLASNPSGFITSSSLSSYLPLSGGTVTGALTVNSALEAGGTGRNGSHSFGSNLSGAISWNNCQLEVRNTNAGNVGLNLHRAGHSNVSLYHDSGSQMRCNGIFIGDNDIRSQSFLDLNDTAWYVDPAGYTRISALQSIGTSGNWNTDFTNTPANGLRYTGDLNSGTNCPTGGGWWFLQNYRHSNSSNFWGVQVAWGWEDRANELYTRNVSGGGYGSWIRYWNSANAPGAILQVQQTHWSGVATVASSSFVNHPNLSVSITPRSSSSRILIMVSMQATVYNLTTQLRFTRNDTPIGIADAAGSRVRSTFGALQTTGDGNHQFTPWNFKFVDSPGTTAALTYRIQLKMQSGATAFLNRSSADADNSDWAQRTTSNIIVMEIAG